MKKTFTKVIATLGRKAAIKSSGTASGFGCYQPTEPKALKALKK